MNARRSALVALPHLVDGFIKTQGLEGRLLEFSLQQRWPLIVGAHIAGHTYPESIRHRRLYLLAENSVWLQQLVFLKTELLAKIAASVGAELLVDLVLRVGLIPSSPSRVEIEAAPVDAPVPDERHRASIDEAVAIISDGLLTEQLRALFQKCAAPRGTIGAARSVLQTGSGSPVVPPPVA